MVERYSKGLRFLLARKIGDDERARDLLQETFCIAIEKLRTTQLDNPERLAGYLRGIAVRVAMNAVRKRNREPYPIDSEAVAAIPNHEPQQFQSISQDETRKAVQELLDTMPVKRDRELLIRLYVYDQDKSEICQALGLDSLHFNRVLHRAKARFRKIVEKSVAVTGRHDGHGE
ncbi:MAG: sigma-70 family RNA polymerase sigma factor [Gammaproteobacteria bacterium]|nr:sigma-70 family RNA polymerase sigma factor [Gammaproteobacteria bacterium]